MTRIYRRLAFQPLFVSVGRPDDGDMLLTVILTVGFVGLLIVVGRLADELLGADADRWARRVAAQGTREMTARRGDPT